MQCTDIVYPLETDKTIELDCASSEHCSSVLFTGRISFNSPESAARVVLIDKNGTRYLVAEMVAQYTPSKDTLLTDEGIETSILPENVMPARIKIAVRNATVEIERLSFSHDVIAGLKRMEMQKRQYQSKENRETGIVDYINRYNEANSIYWCAQRNRWSYMSYDQKCASLGMDDADVNWGYEYYGGGFMVLGATSYNSLYNLPLNRRYVKEFDWRNRHGQNWITPVKNQMISIIPDVDSNCCWAFATVAAAEARANLYYNRHLDLDLSEEYLIAYTPRRYYYGSIYHGYPTFDVHWPMNFMVTDGVIDEATLPFAHIYNSNNVIPNKDSLAPQEKLTFGGINNITRHTYTEDSIKKHLINDGPLYAGLRTTSSGGGHAMLLVGYKVLEIGDTICTFNSNGYDRHVVLTESDVDLIGTTCWMMKDSYGAPSPRRGDGYFYAGIPDSEFHSIFRSAVSLSGRVTSMNYTDDSIVVEDADGDGYYNWGIGPKPSLLPMHIPDFPDSDDTDGDIGPMDEYGYFLSMPHSAADTIFVWNNKIWDNNRHINYQLVVRPGATLRIHSNVTMTDDAHIFVEQGGTLVVDGGNISNANIVVRNGGSTRVANGGTIEMNPNSSFIVPVGAAFQMQEGLIQ